MLAALATALQLDGAERLHLYALACTAAAPAGEAGRDVQAVRLATYRLMELLAEAPAILLGRRTDILAVNDAAQAVFTNFTALPARERNDRAAASRAADRRYFLAEMRIAREPLPVPADRQRP